MIGSSFLCNLCGGENVFSPIGDWREAPSCGSCGSSVRMRHLVHCLTLAASGRTIASMRVVGLSDSDVLARYLSGAFRYTNSYYHREPRLNICSPAPPWLGSADALISSDVFEHVVSPVSSAFAGAFAVLKPGGTLIMTVPYDARETTTEHFPEVGSFKLLDFEGEWLLIGRTASGTYQLHSDLVFHGGPGTTVEMRFFARDAVVAHLREAGFVDIRIHDEPVPQAGIFLAHDQGLPITARKPLTRTSWRRRLTQLPSGLHRLCRRQDERSFQP